MVGCCLWGEDFAERLAGLPFAAKLAKSKQCAHRSISPNTISREPMIAATSASMCPRLKPSIACKWANEGARILHL
jgi:hypothetical protein